MMSVERAEEIKHLLNITKNIFESDDTVTRKELNQLKLNNQKEKTDE